MDGTLASPLDLKDLCGCPLNPNDLLCFQQTSFTSDWKLHKSFGFEGLPLDLKTAPDLYITIHSFVKIGLQLKKLSKSIESTKVHDDVQNSHDIKTMGISKMSNRIFGHQFDISTMFRSQVSICFFLLQIFSDFMHVILKKLISYPALWKKYHLNIWKYIMSFGCEWSWSSGRRVSSFNSEIPI